MKYRLFIGWNNETKELESEKIHNITSKYFDGFTSILAQGFWKGTAEDTRILEIMTDQRTAVYNLTDELKRELKQESIMLETLKGVEFI
jgi:hypothetical protein